jgi:hypothetical protein
MAEKERREGASPEWLRRWKAAHRTEKRAWRRSAPVDTDAKLQLFRVPERGMRLLLVDSPAGEGELRRQLASALVELWGRHSTEPLAAAMVQTRCLAGVGAWPRHPRQERKEVRRRSTAAPFKAVTARGSSPGLGSRHAAEGMGRGPGPTGGRR